MHLSENRCIHHEKQRIRSVNAFHGCFLFATSHHQSSFFCKLKPNKFSNTGQTRQGQLLHPQYSCPATKLPLQVWVCLLEELDGIPLFNQYPKALGKNKFVYNIIKMYIYIYIVKTLINTQ